MKKMEAPAPCALPEELEITEIDLIDDVFTIAAHSTQKYPCCPLCGTPAQRFHGHYIREAKRRRKRPSVFDPYAEYVLSRWEQGCTNGLQLWQEIQAQGYQGSAQTIYRYLRDLRDLRKKRRVIWRPEVPHAPLQDFSAHDAVWLFARAPDSLEEKEQETLTAICQTSETASTTYQLVQEFRLLLHHREGEKLDACLAKSVASQIREFQSFVQGIERDKAAVVAGLTLSQNNGLVEGKVNKLKLMKRMGYGRAGFTLLRQRVLHAL